MNDEKEELAEYETPELIRYGQVKTETLGVQNPPSDIITRD